MLEENSTSWSAASSWLIVLSKINKKSGVTAKDRSHTNRDSRHDLDVVDEASLP